MPLFSQKCDDFRVAVAHLSCKRADLEFLKGFSILVNGGSPAESHGCLTPDPIVDSFWHHANDLVDANVKKGWIKHLLQSFCECSFSRARRTIEIDDLVVHSILYL